MPMEIAGLKVERASPRVPEDRHPILFVHGMWGGSWMWDNYLGFFAGRGYTCYALNLRGHHGSKPVADIGRVPFADYVMDARGVVEALGNPILVGHSMGGLLVQKLAELLDPPAVVALTPAAPRGIFPLRTLELARLSLKHLHEFLLSRPITPTFAEADALLFGRTPATERRLAFERLVPESGRMAFDIAIKGAPVDAARVRCPMLVVAGREDRITPATLVRKVALKYGAEFRVYDGHAHMVLTEPGWEEIARDMATWLDGRRLSQATRGGSGLTDPVTRERR
jgi:pimeloyl-ACP methyl ester carboxylesterase